MARSLLLQQATTDPFDTGWVGKIGTVWTGAVLRLTVTGSGRRLVQATRQIAGTTLQLFSQDVPWDSDDTTLDFPLGNFTGQLRVTGGLAEESTDATVKVSLEASGDIVPWDDTLGPGGPGTPSNPFPTTDARNAAAPFVPGSVVYTSGTPTLVPWALSVGATGAANADWTTTGAVVADDTAAEALMSVAGYGSSCQTVAGALWTSGAP